jgi:hypothetical protein
MLLSGPTQTTKSTPSTAFTISIVGLVLAVPGFINKAPTLLGISFVLTVVEPGHFFRSLMVLFSTGFISSEHVS